MVRPSRHGFVVANRAWRRCWRSGVGAPNREPCHDLGCCGRHHSRHGRARQVRFERARQPGHRGISHSSCSSFWGPWSLGGRPTSCTGAATTLDRHGHQGGRGGRRGLRGELSDHDSGTGTVAAACVVRPACGPLVVAAASGVINGTAGPGRDLRAGWRCFGASSPTSCSIVSPPEPKSSRPSPTCVSPGNHFCGRPCTRCRSSSVFWSRRASPEPTGAERFERGGHRPEQRVFAADGGPLQPGFPHHRRLAKQDIAHNRFFITPTIFNNVLWNGVVDAGEVYLLAQHSFYDEAPVTFTPVARASTCCTTSTPTLPWPPCDGSVDTNAVRRDDGQLQVNDLRFGTSPVRRRGPTITSSDSTLSTTGPTRRMGSNRPKVALRTTPPKP